MRSFSLAVIVGFVLLLGASVRGAAAVPAAPAQGREAAYLQQKPFVDNHDDSRVTVQLVVVGVAVAVVVVVGTAGYLLRKKLGLVPPPPPQGSDGHH